jgi:hypothetical protein
VGDNSGGGISNCTAINTHTSSYGKAGGIVGKNEGGGFKNNYITDDSTLSVGKDKSDKRVISSSSGESNDGKSINAGLLNQQFYSRISWDFKNIWIWDNKLNEPILRNKSSTAEISTKKTPFEKNEFSEKLRNNIWL